MPTRQLSTDAPASLTEKFASMQILSTHSSKTLGEFPEELLDDIISYLVPLRRSGATDAQTITVADLSNLRSLSLVSRKFHRLTKPHLYHTIPLTLATFKSWGNGPKKRVWKMKSEMPYPNVQPLYNTLFLRPDLAKHARVVVVRRCELRNVEYEHPVFDSDIERVRADFNPTPGRIVLCTILSELSEDIHHLDLSPYLTGGPLRPFWEVIETQKLANIRTISISHWDRDAWELFPLFTLPSLTTLRIHDLAIYHPRPNIDWAAIEAKWNAIESTSPITDLTIAPISLGYHAPPYTPPLILLFKACKAIKALRLLQETDETRIFRVYLSVFVPLLLPTLQNLVIWDKPRFKQRGAVWPALTYTDTMSTFRHSSGLEHLVIDVNNLVEVVRKGRLDPATSGAYETWSYRGRSYTPYIDLTLPRSLKNLTLRVGSEDSQEGIMSELLSPLNSDVRARFPVLRCLKVCWHSRVESPLYEYFVRKFEEQLRKQGVRFVEEFLSEA